MTAAQDSTDANAAAKQPDLPAWIVTCSNGNPEAAFRCVMQQTLYVSATRQRVLAMTITRDGDNYRASLLLPHGIDFSKGVQYWVDQGKKTSVAVTHADQNGSYAQFSIDATLLESMRKGSVFRIVTKPVSGEDLVIELTLAGFSDALQILQRN